VICFSVDFCTATCNRNHDNDLEELYGYQYEYDFDDKHLSLGFQYPGWGKRPGFKSSDKHSLRIEKYLNTALSSRR
jgi:hypothetical protein